jgi:Na+/melibiose symporter-like transporter
MGTLFSLVDKLVSSLSATVVGVAVSMIGLANLPTAETPYSAGMNWVVIILFCIIPMTAWAITLLVMRKYELTGDRMKEIQKINNKRKEAIANGMTMEEAMKKYK